MKHVGDEERRREKSWRREGLYTVGNLGNINT